MADTDEKKIPIDIHYDKLVGTNLVLLLMLAHGIRNARVLGYYRMAIKPQQDQTDMGQGSCLNSGEDCENEGRASTHCKVRSRKHMYAPHSSFSVLHCHACAEVLRLFPNDASY